MCVVNSILSNFHKVVIIPWPLRNSPPIPARESLQSASESLGDGAAARWLVLRRPPMPAAEADAAGGGGSSENKDNHASNITVAVRVRPLSLKEKARQSWATVEVLDESHVLVSGPVYFHSAAACATRLNRPADPAPLAQVNDPDDKMGGLDYLRLDKTKTKHYRFDFALGPDVTQTEVYEVTNKPLVVKALEGYNACCFAYGASALPPYAP